MTSLKKGGRTRPASWPPTRRTVAWGDLEGGHPTLSPETFDKSFDFREMPHRPGMRIEGSSLGRGPALKPTRAVPTAETKSTGPEPQVDLSWQRAADNSVELEWASARKDLEALAQRSMSAAETGVRLQALLRRVPGLLARDLGLVLQSHVEGGGPDTSKTRELVPLPLPRLTVMRETEIDRMFHSKAVLGPKARQTGAEAWQHLLVAALNGLDAHGNCLSLFGPPTEAQASALKALLKDCQEFVSDDKARTPTDFSKELGAKTESYWGEPVYCAEEITLAQVIPTLPPKGIAASVDICEVVEGQLRDQLRDPESLLVPEEEWPEFVPKAKTMLKDQGEWGSLANELWQRDLTLWLPEYLLFQVHGCPVISGLFGVPKGKEVPGSPGVSQLRLICNLVPSNGFFREIRGDVDHLPYMMQWASLILHDDEVLLISQEDMTCAFYLFRMPRAWCPYFAVGLPITLDELTGNARARDISQRMAGNVNPKTRGYLVLQVLPMGWKSAVGIMQAVHRRLLASSLAQGNRLPTPGEIRKTAPMPTSQDQRTLKGWQAYLDNFASFIVVLMRDAAKFEGVASEWHTKARKAWEAWNIPSAQDKSVANSFEAKELGCFVDGRRGSLGTTTQRRLDAIALSLFLISARNPHRMWLAVTAGRWNFCFQFRRALSSTFYLVWRGIAEWKNCRYLPRSIAQELLTAAFAAPAMITDLRARPDLLVTCSDASPSGAGVAAAAGLTEYGVWAARSLPKELPNLERPGVALVSLFGGIEAGRRALDLLGCHVVRHIAVENNKAAIRAVTEVYADVIHFRDVLEFRREDLHRALAGAHILFVLVTAGFPCQGLSGANATRQGFDDPRSQLFFEGLRVVQDVKAEKHSLEFLFENVASMAESDREVVTRFLGVRPVVACASGISQVRRKRYLWASWPVTSAPGVTVEERAATWKVSFEATLPEPRLWLDPGWEMIGGPDIRFPTFMRALPKKKQTFLPAGIASTPPDARRRWKSDQWRYPPYQYKREFCVRNRRRPRQVRLLNARERETLMFLGRNATKYAVNPTHVKESPQVLEDERCCLIGNTFHAGVVALIFAALLHRRHLLRSRPSPQELVERMGLRPGELYTPGLRCDLDRPASFHRLDGQRRGYLHPSQSAARAAVSEESEPALELQTLNALLRSSDYRGSDIRMDAGELLRPGQWPRRSIDPAKWSWFAVLAHPYHDKEHINILEVRSALLTLRWRSRTAGRIRSRFFHLMDSQVAIAALAKGRSSSWKLNQVLRRVAALTVAAGFAPSFGYFMSEWNPSDTPSRRWEGRSSSSGGSIPRRPRPRKRKVSSKKGTITRRNVKFPKKFDSTRGYPGEGPARATNRRAGRSRMKVVPKLKQKFLEGIPGRRTQSERRLARLGHALRDALLAPTSRRLYAEAFQRLWVWAGCPPPADVESAAAYDRFLALYIEEAWAEGLTRGEAGNALSASLTIYPQLRGRGRLSDSWFLLNAWARYEVPMRAPPMPVEVVLGLAWYFVRMGQLGGAALLVLGFDCFLRTGELLSLIISDVILDEGDTGVVKLEHTKTGRRTAAFEASTINDPLSGRLFRAFLRSLPACTSSRNYVFMPKVHVFYRLFRDGLRWLGLESYGFLPYSMRRGGATAFFRATRNMEAALDRGRWGSVRVARIYLNDGLAREVEMRFPPQVRERLRIYADALQQWLTTTVR